jgi:predicted metal-dependent hydrolase
VSDLVTDSRFPDPDAAYRLLAEAHRRLTAEESTALNARLVLLLANQIGDIETLRQALELAGKGLGAEPRPAST